MSARPAAGAPDPLGRDLLLFQLYRFLSTSYLFQPILVVFFTQRGLSMLEVTLLNTVYAVTAIACEVPTGVLADRFGRRRAMVLGSLMMSAGCAVDFLGHGFGAFAVGEGLLALGMTLSSGADSAWLYDLLLDAGREGEYRRREGAASASKLVGMALAIGVGGWLATRDVAATYLVTSLVCLSATVVALLLREGEVVRRSRRLDLGARTMESARLVVDRPALGFAVVFSTLVFTLLRMSNYLHQPYLSAAGMDLAQVGGVMAVMSLAGAVAAHRIDALRRTVGEPALVVGLPLSLALGYGLLGALAQAGPGQAAALLGVAILVGQSVANGIWSPLSKDLINREIDDSSHRATVLSVESMVRRLAFGLVSPLCGFAIMQYGLPGGLWACAALGGFGTSLLALHVVGRRGRLGHGFEGERTPTPLPDEEPAPRAEMPEAMPQAIPQNMPKLRSGPVAATGRR